MYNLLGHCLEPHLAACNFSVHLSTILTQNKQLPHPNPCLLVCIQRGERLHVCILVVLNGLALCSFLLLEMVSRYAVIEQGYSEAAMIEFDVLREVARYDKSGTRCLFVVVCRVYFRSDH